jgi:hypothetical protein
MKTKLMDLYISQTLDANKTPESVYLFAKSAGIAESEFYNEFSSLESLETEIFAEWWNKTTEQAGSTEVFNTYSAREKVLSLFFMWIENLKANRSFVNFLYKRDHHFPPKMPAYIKPLKEAFSNSIKPILSTAIDTNEVVDRKYLSDKYVDALWLNFIFITNFWMKDHSKAFEKTDEAIERSINLSFDMLGKSPLDSALEFGKFLFQNR